MSLIVRWLGAFGRTTGGLELSVKQELEELGRQVAAEPCFFGESRLSQKERALIGLSIDMKKSVFVQGWLVDAYTQRETSGLLTACRDNRGKTFRDLGRLIKAATPLFKLPRDENRGHGEVSIDYPRYDAIVVCRHASDEVKAKAKALATKFNLGYLVVVRLDWKGSKL